MTISRKSGWVLLGTILAAAIFSAPAYTALPDNSYACQVETKNSGPGLVAVQAHSSKAARKLALQFDALTRNGTRARPTALVECIKAPEGRFSDSTFQYFYENLER